MDFLLELTLRGPKEGWVNPLKLGPLNYISRATTSEGLYRKLCACSCKPNIEIILQSIVMVVLELTFPLILNFVSINKSAKCP
jgi:hypothetical protein